MREIWSILSKTLEIIKLYSIYLAYYCKQITHQTIAYQRSFEGLQDPKFNSQPLINREREKETEREREISTVQ
jgi:hypothetical protein